MASRGIAVTLLAMAYRALLCCVVASLLAWICGCSGSESSSQAVDGRFDVAALSDDVFRLCETAQCSDYSEDECTFYLRYDILEYAYLSQDPETCYAAFRTVIGCLADAGSCDDESCSAPDDACTFSQEVPGIEVPEVVQPAQVACEFRADCQASSSGGEDDRELTIAECQVEYIVRSEIFQHDRGPDCVRAFIDFLVCIGESDDVPCSPSAEEEEAACPTEVARLDSLCFDEA